jgi:hypothetical protein
MGEFVMKMESSVRKSGGSNPQVMVRTVGVLFAMLAGCMVSAGAQNPYSSYIPTAVPTATSTLFSNGATSISPGRVAVDKAGNAFYVGHVTGSASTLYEIPAASPVVTVTTPTALISGLGQTGSNSAMVDAAGTLWVSNGNGSGAALIEIPASNGIPNIAAITGSSNYNSTGLPFINVSVSCTSASTAACIWSAGSISSSLTSLQIGDVYSDGNGNVYLVDVSDSVSAGAYNRVIEFNTSIIGTISVLADKLTSNAYAQVTVAGDGNVYYCDSVTGNSSGGLVSVISSGSLTTVANVSNASLTLLNGIVKVTAATGITSDIWGNLIISGPKQLAEVPLENGALNFADQFNLIVAISGSNAPMYSNNVVYGGTFDVHGSYYYASATNIMQVQVNGYNFGKVNVGTEVTTAAPYFTLTWDIPSYLIQSGMFPTASPSTLSSANAAYLQSFPNANSKNFFGGTPYSASNTGQYLLMYFQPVHAGLLRGADSPQGYMNALAITDPPCNSSGTVVNPCADYSASDAYVVNLQGVGVGPQPMFLPGTASQAVSLSQLYTSSSHTTKAVGFTPTSAAVDTYGDIFVVDNANSSLDVDCLATTSNTSAALSSFCQANAPGYAYKVGYTLNKNKIYPSFVTPVDVVLDGANNAYVLDSGSSTPIVSKFPYDTMIPSVVVANGTTVAGTALSSPQGLAIDGYANLYIADTGNNRILQAHQYNAAYSQNIVYVPSTVKFGGIALSGPTGMGLDASGNLFIADTGNSRIVEYSITGVASVVSTTGVTLAAPTGITVLPSGALVVADTSKGLILVDNGVGSALTTGSVTLTKPQALSLDLAGNIYIADSTGAQIVELNVNSPATMATFANTLRGSSSSKTSMVYNSGNAALTFSAAPAIVDNSIVSTNDFALDSSNGCTGTTSVIAAGNCSLIVDFTPSSTADLANPTTGTVTLANNLQSYTVSSGIGSFGTTGSTQNLSMSGQATVNATLQPITFTTATTSVTWSSSIPPITLSATGGGSGNPVVFSILSGGGTLSGTNNNTLTLTGVGSTVIAANQAGGVVSGITYAAASQTTETITVNPVGIVATPTLSVAAGTYTATQSVSISDSTSGSSIYYTIDGSTPTPSSTLYSGAITVATTTTVNAIAVETGYTSSAIASASYTIAVPTPTFSVATGSYTATQTVSIADTMSGSTIYYTLNGTTPTTSSTLYSGAITVAATTTVNAIAVATGYTNSSVATATYTIVVPTPTFSVATGSYPSTQTVTIADTMSGATIYYTLNGTTPSPSSTAYTGALTVGSTATLQAIAVKTGDSSSVIASATYTLIPDFTITLGNTITAAKQTITIVNGHADFQPITITPLFGFNSGVAISCSGLPANYSCNYSVPTATPSWPTIVVNKITMLDPTATSGTAATSTVFVEPNALTSAKHSGPNPFLPTATLAAALCFFGFRKRNRLLLVVLLVMSAAGLEMLSGCGSSAVQPNVSTTSTVTVTGTSGTTVHSTTFTLVVTSM